MSLPDLARRNFMVRSILGIGALLTAAIGIPLGGFIILPTLKRKEPEWSEAGSVESLKVNEPEERRFFQTVRSGYYEEKVERSVWLVKRDNGTLSAYSSSCPHLGCGYRWDDSDSKFKCPCHASVFSVDGKLLGGPSPRGLDILETKQLDGKVLIKFRVFQTGAQKQIEI